MKGVYSVRHDTDDNPGFSAVFYCDAKETALMQFFLLLQKETQLDYVSEETAKKMSRMVSKFKNDDCMEGLFWAALFFFSEVEESVIEEFCELGRGRIGADCYRSSELLLQDFIEEYGIAIKNLTVYDGIVDLPSYCTIKIPAAYLVRSGTDVNGYYKNWLSDAVLHEIFIELSKIDILNSATLERVLSTLSGVYDVALAELSMMVESLLVNELLKYSEEAGGIDLDYRKVINILIERLGGVHES